MNEMTPAQQAQHQNRTNDGKYATKQHAEADIDLGAGMTPDSIAAFAAIRNTPTPEDVRDGYDMAHRELDYTQSNWSAVMGDQRRTKANMDAYRRELDCLVDQDPKALQTQRWHAQHSARWKSWGRAYQQSIPIDPEVEQHFETIWESSMYNNDGLIDYSQGYGREALEHELTEYQHLKAGVLDGSVKPSCIIKGARKASALDYLDDRIDRMQLGLDTRGRLFLQNALTVEHHLNNDGD